MSSVTKTSHSSLSAEFDAANEAALSDIWECDTCEKFSFSGPDGRWCVDKVCTGRMYKENMIKLPGQIKTGKKEYKSYSSGQIDSYSYDSTKYKPCEHPGKKLIFEHKGKKIYASNSHSLNERSGLWDLIMDLAGVAYIPQPQLFIGDKSPSKYRELKQFITEDKFKYPDVLRLYWQDMGVPPVSLGFWVRLWDLLPERTVICCIGGHGRTGTAIASLMVAVGVDYYSAVNTVRAEHCNKAIESPGQELYIHSLYVDILKISIKVALDADNALEAESFTKDLEYATSHRPTQASSMGEIVPVKMVPKTEDKVVIPMGGDDSDDEILTKVIAGKMYVSECVNTECKVMDCKVGEHQGWVEWDKSLTSMSMV